MQRPSLISTRAPLPPPYHVNLHSSILPLASDATDGEYGVAGGGRGSEEALEKGKGLRADGLLGTAEKETPHEARKHRRRKESRHLWEEEGRGEN